MTSQAQLDVVRVTYAVLEELCCSEYKHRPLRLVMNSYASCDCTLLFCYISSKVLHKETCHFNESFWCVEKDSIGKHRSSIALSIRCSIHAIIS